MTHICKESIRILFLRNSCFLQTVRKEISITVTSFNPGKYKPYMTIYFKVLFCLQSKLLIDLISTLYLFNVIFKYLNRFF